MAECTVEARMRYLGVELSSRPDAGANLRESIEARLTAAGVPHDHAVAAGLARLLREAEARLRGEAPDEAPAWSSDAGKGRRIARESSRWRRS